MRNLLIGSTMALALGACGPKAADTTPNVNAMASGSGDMAVPPANDASATAMGAPATAVDTVTTEQFVPTAAMSDMFETTAGKIAAKKATAADVKSFAQKMVEAHTETTRGLKAALAKDNVAITPPTALDAKHQALIDALNAAPAASFDLLYKSQQVDAHNEALTLMKSYAASGDKPAIKAFATDTAPKVQMHIDMLNKLG